MTEEQTFPNPLMVGLGDGRMICSPFSDDEGCGIMFSDTGKEHKPDTVAPVDEGERMPSDGEVYIHCKNPESAHVVMEMAIRAYIMSHGEVPPTEFTECLHAVKRIDCPQQPRWMKRPSGPGLWVCSNNWRQGTEGVMRLDAADLQRGAPFQTDCVFGPIPEPQEEIE